MHAGTRSSPVFQDGEMREIARRANGIATNVASVILGKEEVIQACVVALLAGGHIIIEDYPGVGKTLLAKALARSVSCRFARIQFTPDLLPSDVTGVSVFNHLLRPRVPGGGAHPGAAWRGAHPGANACEIEPNRLGQLRARAWENRWRWPWPTAPPPGNGHSTVVEPMAFTSEGVSRDPRLFEAGEKEGVFVARLDLEALMERRRSEVWGGARRHPEAYGHLTELGSTGGGR